jgi:CubicO group peptidase (beta-lactamase class C family)
LTVTSFLNERINTLKIGILGKFICSGLLLISTSSWCAESTAGAEAGLMQGFPPPEDKRINRNNFMVYPNTRWAFQHIRELYPTREIYRGTGPSLPLAADPADLDNLEFSISGDRRVSLATWMDEAATDSFLVLHRGRIVYERYFNGMQPLGQHQMFSATKSFIGTMVLMLIEEGRINPDARIDTYIPELKDSAFGDATVQQVLNMTTSITYNEDYVDPEADIWKYGIVFGFTGDPPPGYSGPLTSYDYLPTLRKADTQHGHAFHYVTPNADALGWLLSRVSGQSVSAFMEKYLWQRLGVERDGYIWLDRAGTEMAGGGLNITARDAARFGQMILQKGHFNGQQIIPPAVAERILQAGDPAPFSRFHKGPWYENMGYAYHDQWWTFNNAHKAVSAIGVHGQFIYIDPIAQMVIVKQSSHPDAEGVSNDVDGPMIWHAIAEYLMKD